jgi:hypothetical protein
VTLGIHFKTIPHNEHFGDELLRHPTIVNTQCLPAKVEEREFSGILESIDCMHWQ